MRYGARRSAPYLYNDNQSTEGRMRPSRLSDAEHREADMKLLLSMALLVVCLGCAGTPTATDELALTCLSERTAVLANEWARYESVTGQRMFFPDWRGQVRQWARVECSRGRPVAAFHPWDTATARRHY